MSKNALRDMILLYQREVPTDAHWPILRLRELGYDFDKLLNVVSPRGRGRPKGSLKPRVSSGKRGSPKLVEISNEALDTLIVRGELPDGEKDNPRARIRAFLKDYARDVKHMTLSRCAATFHERDGTPMTPDALVRHLHDRWRRHASKKPRSGGKTWAATVAPKLQ